MYNVALEDIYWTHFDCIIDIKSRMESFYETGGDGQSRSLSFRFSNEETENGFQKEGAHGFRDYSKDDR